MDRVDALSLLAGAVRELLEDEPRCAVDPGEASVTARLAALMSPRFPAWSVDAEYDRNRTLEKMLFYGFAEEVEKLRRIRPDIIVHKINSTDNLIVIEAKRFQNGERAKDIAKLRAMTSFAGGYSYMLEVRLVTNLPRSMVQECEVFISGETSPEETALLSSMLPMAPRG